MESTCVKLKASVVNQMGDFPRGELIPGHLRESRGFPQGGRGACSRLSCRTGRISPSIKGLISSLSLLTSSTIVQN